MFLNVIDNIIINKVKQCVSIRSRQKDAPLLLYLHGGPGDAALPLVLKYNKQLEEYFTVVVWEQRGSGKSYYKFTEQEEISIDTFIKDTYCLVTQLLNRFRQEKIYIVGHSWGSVIGLKFSYLYPHLVNNYIGCGQVVNMHNSSKIAYDYALKKSITVGNEKIINKLKAIDYTYTSDTWLADLLFVTKLVVKYKGSLYGKTNYNSFVWDFLVSSDYHFKDLINREKGSLQSINCLWPELMTIDFEDIKSFHVPVIFIEGRNDYHVSAKLAENYYKTIKTQKQFYWFEKSCHFPQWSEADRFNHIVISLLDNKL